MNLTNINLYKDKKWPIVILILLLAFVYQLSSIDSYHNWHGGAFQYLNQTKALLTGQVSELNTWANTMEKASSDTRIPSCYPWGIPLLYALPYYLSDGNLLVLKIFQSLLVLASGLLLFRFLSEKTNLLIAFAGLSLLLFNPYLTQQINIINSSIASMFFGMLIIYLHSRKTIYKNLLRLIAFSLILTFATLTRTNNAILCLLIFFLIVIEKRQKATLPLTILIPPLLLYHLYIKGFLFGQSENVYLKFFNGDFSSYFLDNAKHYLVNISKLFYPTETDQLLLSLLIVVVLGGSILILIKKSIQLIYLPIYIALHLLLLFVWPYQEGARLMIELIPVILICILVGAFHLLQKGKVLQTSILASFLLITFGYMIFTPKREHNKGPFSKDAKELFSYINKQDESNIYIFFRPRVFRYFCAQYALTTTNPDKFKGRQKHYYITAEYGLSDRRKNLAYFRKKYKNIDIIFKNKTFSVIKY